MKRFYQSLITALSVLPALLVGVPAFADITSMMNNLENTVLLVLAPIVCVCGLILSGFKLAMGDESGKSMMICSCIGTVLTFSAPTILSYLQNRVAS